MEEMPIRYQDYPYNVQRSGQTEVSMMEILAKAMWGVSGVHLFQPSGSINY